MIKVNSAGLFIPMYQIYITYFVIDALNIEILLRITILHFLMNYIHTY